MATRDFKFVTGPETSALPSAGTPTNDKDSIHKGYADDNYTSRFSYENSKADLSALQGIGSSDRADNQIVFVDGLQRFYQFDTNSTASADGFNVVRPSDLAAADPGRWLRADPDVKEVEQQASTPSNPKSGFQRYYFKTDGSFYKLDSNGNEIKVGGAGTAGINYLTDEESTAETGGTGGYSTYADSAAKQPDDGTGGTPNVTFSNQTSNVLRENKSFRLAKTANNRQGEGFSIDKTIDDADQAAMMEVSFDYEASSNFGFGDASDPAGSPSDIVFYVLPLDGSNTSLIQPAPFTLDNTGNFSATFQTTADATQYRLIWHIATTNSSAWDFDFDNVRFGPARRNARGFAGTDAESFSPVSNLSTNIQEQNGYQWRVGDRLHVQAYLEFNGSNTEGFVHPSLPSGLSIDTSKIASKNGTNNALGLTEIGTWKFHDSSADTTYTGVVTYNESSSVIGLYNNASNLISTSGNEPVTIADNDEFTWQFTVPISGWSSNTVVSHDAALRDVAAEVYAGSSQTISSSGRTTISLNTVQKDSLGAFDTGNNKYVVEVPGWYAIHAAVLTDGGTLSDGDTVTLFINEKVSNTDLARTNYTSHGTAETIKVEKQAVFLNAGDEIILEAAAGASLDTQAGSRENTYLSLHRIANATTVQAAEQTYLQFYLSGSNQSITADGTTTKIAYDAVDIDSHNQANTSSNEANIVSPGQYWAQAQAQIGGNDGDVKVIELQVNGSTKATGKDTAGSGSQTISRTGRVLNLQQGDTVSVLASCNSSNSSVPINNGEDLTFLSLYKLTGVQ